MTLGQLIYPRDRLLTIVSMIIGVLLWGLGVATLYTLGGKVGVAVLATTVVLVTIISFIGYVFARSAAIAHLMGNGVEVSGTQLPEIYGQFIQCCERLSLDTQPGIYVLNGNGVLNAFATWFLGRKYVVLLSSVVDAMQENPNGLRFYIGHELAHVIRHDNPILWVLRWPALILPLLGASYSRARESTCDFHGLACSESREGAARSLIALSAGATLWKSTSLEGVRRQLAAGTGFWISFHELTASYPWNTKRVIRVLDEAPVIPSRNPFAYVLAAFVPYAGRLGSGIGMLLYVYVIALLAAIAIPAYQSYTVRAVLATTINDSQQAREALSGYYEKNKQLPESLDAAGIGATGPNGIALSLNPENMTLSVTSTRGTLIFTPSADSENHVRWICSGGPDLKPAELPPSCRN